MTRDAQERLRDIVEAVSFVEAHVGGSLVDPDISDAMALHAVLFNFIVVGEAAKRVDKELRDEAPEVRWRDYAGLRDIIAHQYFRIQKQIIEDTVRKDLPTLQSAVARLLA